MKLLILILALLVTGCASDKGLQFGGSPILGIVEYDANAGGLVNGVKASGCKVYGSESVLERLQIYYTGEGCIVNLFPILEEQIFEE